MATVIIEKSSGAYLLSYDAEAHDGRGEANWTYDIGHALRFESKATAHFVYTSVPTCRPVLTDQSANRPLTAFKVLFQEVP